MPSREEDYAMRIGTAGIVGAGTMGSGIAQPSALHDCDELR
jgi:3-hydroxyacyl-CoA dehydrogenase